MRINVHFHNLADHTSFYRAWGPLNALAKDHPEVRLIGLTGEAPDWMNIMRADIAFVHRPGSEENARCIKRYKDYGVPVWADIDDDFYHVPRDSSAYGHFNNQKNQEAIKKALGMVDVLTVSTPLLADLYKNDCAEIRVVRNGLHDFLIPRKVSPQKNKRILWRGNSTHVRDIGCVKDGILQFALTHKDYTWIFMGGYDPYEITEVMERENISHRVYNWISPIADYFDALIQLNPEIVIVPLVDKNFNHAKSNIAWLEGTLAGASCVVPSWPEWKNDGVMTYARPEDFAKELELVAGQYFPYNEVSWDLVKKEYLLSKANVIRMEIIERLMGYRK